MEIGVVAVKSINSNYYLAMNKNGKVYGSVSIFHLSSNSVPTGLARQVVIYKQGANPTDDVTIDPLSGNALQTDCKKLMSET